MNPKSIIKVSIKFRIKAEIIMLSNIMKAPESQKVVDEKERLDDKVDVASKIKEKTITQPNILIPMTRGKCNQVWNYKYHGKDWECLCKEGKFFI